MSFIDNTNDSGCNKEQHVCTCPLCEKISHEVLPIIKTTKLCILILKSLKVLKPSNEYFSLKHDINGFITDHWSLLSKLRQFVNPNWRKSLLDAFNHCNLIESGKEVCHNRGYYRLKDVKKENKAEKKQKKQVKQPTEKRKQRKTEKVEKDGKKTEGAVPKTQKATKQTQMVEDVETMPMEQQLEMMQALQGYQMMPTAQGYQMTPTGMCYLNTMNQVVPMEMVNACTQQQGMLCDSGETMQMCGMGENMLDLRSELFLQLEVLQAQMMENHCLLTRYPYQYIVDGKSANALPVDFVVQNNLYHYGVLEQYKQFLCFLEVPKVQEAVPPVDVPVGVEK